MPGNAHHALASERLVLEPVSLANLRLLWRLMRAPDLRRHQDIPRMPLDRFAERIYRRSPLLTHGAVGRFEWIIRERQRNEAAGWISIRFSDRRPARGELGYSILMPWRRNGYASEAVTLVTGAVFAAGAADTVEAYCVPENSASLGVMRRSGLRERERLRHGAVLRGVPVDVLRFEITRDNWRHGRRRLPVSTGARQAE